MELLRNAEENILGRTRNSLTSSNLRPIPLSRGGLAGGGEPGSRASAGVQARVTVKRIDQGINIGMDLAQEYEMAGEADGGVERPCRRPHLHTRLAGRRRGCKGQVDKVVGLDEF